jgi:hypothetical protein
MVHLKRPGPCLCPAAKEFGRVSFWLLPGDKGFINLEIFKPRENTGKVVNN